MQYILLVLCLLLFVVLLMPLSILGHELGHAVAMVNHHSHGKPIILCLGCKMTFDSRTGKYYRPTSSWTMRWPRLLLIVAPSTRAAFFGLTYGQEQLSVPQRFWMLLAGPLTSLGLTLIWGAGAWCLLHAVSLPQTRLETFWLQVAHAVFFLCCANASYNGLLFLLSILPIPNRTSQPLSHKTALSASGGDGYQLLRLWREHLRRPDQSRG